MTIVIATLWLFFAEGANWLV